MLKYLFFLILCLQPIASFAAENVSVRFGKHTEYERLVFEWPANAPNYTIEKQANKITLKLPESVVLKTDQIAGADSDYIQEFQIQSEDQVSVFLSSYENIRDMRLGKKIIIDVYGGDIKVGQNNPAQSAPPPEKPIELPSKDIEKVAAVPVQETPVNVSPVIKQSELTEEKVSDKPPPQTNLGKAIEQANEQEPHAFVLSSTEGIRLAAYERFGSLWILANQINLPIEPYIEGTNKDQFGALTRYEVANDTATLWEFKLPSDYSVIGEGGSLYWRLILSQGFRENTIAPSVPEKKNVTSNSIRSGEIAFPVAGEKTLIKFLDPVAGDEIHAVVVDTSEIYSNKHYEFVDFEALESPVGYAFLTKNPNLNVAFEGDSVVIGADEGLVLTRPSDVSKSIEEKKSIRSEKKENQIFDFREWQMGSENALEENQKLLMNSLRGKNNSGRAERFLTLAKLNLAHSRGVEAKGFVENAVTEMPQLQRSAIIRALRGVAHHIAGQNDLAIQDFVHPSLAKYPEINLWKAATLAHLGDWQQAIETLPDDFSTLLAYPQKVSTPLIITLAEVALRNGDKATGETLLAKLEQDYAELTDSHKNGAKYLKGEIFRQNGEIEEAIATWKKLSQEEDPLYRTKAELSLVALGRNDNTVSKEDAVNRLENLRYVWRGDDLELQVLRQLGLAEIEAEKYVNGFKTLRDTVVLSTNSQVNDSITNLMMQTYENLFLTDKLQTVSPIDAAMLYEEFRELTPSGDKGDLLVARLAERLVDANLLGRAVKLLAYQLDYRLKGKDAVDTALRMASIQLMDRRPEDALMTLSKAQVLLDRIEMPNKNLKRTDLELLKARALSDAGDVSGALELLEGMKPPSRDISRLEADIAWRDGRWNDAAAALRQLVLTEEFDPEADLAKEQSQLLMNYAIALNLSNQRITLRNIRERHLGQMQATAKGELFEVITRPRQEALLADRATLTEAIGETEIFSDFLDSYKTQ